MKHARLPVLITRAEPGASETAARVGALGGAPIVSPTLAFKSLDQSLSATANTYAGLVFTSANGVRAFAAVSDNRDLRAWCVGPATARAAREHGFEQVRESSGNAIDLAHYIADDGPSETLPLLHVANAAAKGDLKAKLVDLGFSVEFAPLYEMVPADAFSAEALAAITADAPALVLIHSAKGAQSFVRLCGERSVAHLTAVAISEPASRPLLPLELEALHISRRPNEDGLMLALQSAIATLSA